MRTAGLALILLAGSLTSACSSEEADNQIAAAAQENAPSARTGRRAGGWRRADANGDGAVSREEVGREADARFARLDANGDGRLTGDEMTGAMRRADADDTGPITAASYRDRAFARFDRADGNRNGLLEGDELRRGRGGRRDAERDEGRDRGAEASGN